MVGESGDVAETELYAAIATEKTRLAELDRLIDAASRRLADLHTARERAAERDAEAQRATNAAATWSPERKVALFASLFRGRENVFPRRWEKPGKARSGWAPRCSNEWVPGVCAKPRVRCGECSHQAFVAPVEAERLAHLQGRQVMGVYPLRLLADDTCRLLAVDLDGSSWRGDVVALREACGELGVVPAV